MSADKPTPTPPTSAPKSAAAPKKAVAPRARSARSSSTKGSSTQGTPSAGAAKKATAASTRTSTAPAAKAGPSKPTAPAAPAAETSATRTRSAKGTRTSSDRPFAPAAPSSAPAPASTRASVRRTGTSRSATSRAARRQSDERPAPSTRVGGYSAVEALLAHYPGDVHTEGADEAPPVPDTLNGTPVSAAIDPPTGNHPHHTPRLPACRGCGARRRLGDRRSGLACRLVGPSRPSRGSRCGLPMSFGRSRPRSPRRWLMPAWRPWPSGAGRFARSALRR